MRKVYTPSRRLRKESPPGWLKESREMELLSEALVVFCPPLKASTAARAVPSSTSTRVAMAI